jgi:NADPH-dependent glutamate synthase beta subunit-like oxidoreductase/ferredoxin
VLKRFATDHDTGLWKAKSKVASSTGKRVAIVGAGPAGLTAAYYLAKLGHSVTIFEALSEPGGMMRVGIPDYRLPKNLLKAEIDEIKAVGVDIKTNTRVESLDNLFEQGYNTIFVALGAHQGMSLGVEGEDHPQVMDCASFLREVSLGREVEIGNRVAVVGGGNAAVDSARSSLRLGAKEVTIVYRRTRAEMPANPEEVEAALAEGIEIYLLAAPSRVYSQDGKLQLECIRMQLGEPDASGRRRPEPIKGSEFTMSFDNIIAAIGQRPEVPEQFSITIGRGNTIQADPETLATDREGVFAGGDVMTGPASVIEAIADGRQGAISMDKYLGGKGIIDETLVPPQEKATPLTSAEKGRRVHPPELSPEVGISSFAEVELELSEEMAVKEAERCLKCDLAYVVDRLEVDLGHCVFCGLCVEMCPRHALSMDYGYERARYRRQELILQKEELLLTGAKQPSGYARPEFEAAFPEQTLLIDKDFFLGRVKR